MSNTLFPVTPCNKKVTSVAADVGIAHEAPLRDQFATAALTGYLASTGDDFEPADVASSIARECYLLADCMLEARAGKIGMTVSYRHLHQIRQALGMRIEHLRGEIANYRPACGYDLETLQMELAASTQALEEVTA